jgi:GNAT superfamily N-acetyltransferase
MTRSSVVLREATAADVDALAEIWRAVLRRAEPQEQRDDVRRILAEAELEPSARVVVAEYDGTVAGAVYLCATTLTPINLEPAVMTVSPHVLPGFRRHGVGRSLMEAAVAFADEHGVGHLATAAASGSRDGNRFMARLALAPQAVLRVAPVPLVRAKLNPQRAGARQVTQVLAARRSQRQRQRGVAAAVAARSTRPVG